MHILIIDDYPLAHRAWKRALQGMPIKLTSALTYTQAEEVLETLVSSTGRSSRVMMLPRSFPVAEFAMAMPLSSVPTRQQTDVDQAAGGG